ncbi:hypothetical protein N7452_007502 [Penicillium brevicompactum]|uniref:Uncharacterized protein n=1 Tax=Penicillium brevicompactum TaxID=5074 RepID=A0A9W9UDL5_PENBR|nr:hypothetical protein N7452_007502 [Penicillium brevicompactum]
MVCDVMEESGSFVGCNTPGSLTDLLPQSLPRSGQETLIVLYTAWLSVSVGDEGNRPTESMWLCRSCCPQNHVDFRHLLRIPDDEFVPELRQDEFTCLNLDVTMPEPGSVPGMKRDLPVLFWIHGK